MTRRFRPAASLLVSACGLALIAAAPVGARAEEPAHSAALDEMIVKSAARHGIPEALVRRVVMRESKYNPQARNHKYWGLMQISYPTAKSMGFHGLPQDLLNPVVNLRYAVPYLANAFIIAGRREDAAVRLYARGYYDTARRRGLLGALRTADSTPLSGVPDDPQMAAVAPPGQAAAEQSTGLFGALFGPAQMPRDPQSEQAVYAAAAPAAAAPAVAAEQPAAAVASAHGGKSGDDVMLVADKAGVLHPPKKWQHDGGSTVVARGEQALDQVAAYEKASAAPDSEKPSRHHSHKSTVFASLDLQPASAQAYAGTGGPQDPRLMQADSQAAITQATSGQLTAAPAAQPAAVAATDPTTPTTEVPEKTIHRHRVAHRDRHRTAPDAPTAQASTAPDQQQASSTEPQSQAAPDQAATVVPRATAPDATVVADTAVAQTGYPPDAGGDPRQNADAIEPTETSKPRHRSHHARAHKATTLAARTTDGPPNP